MGLIRGAGRDRAACSLRQAFVGDNVKGAIFSVQKGPPVDARRRDDPHGSTMGATGAVNFGIYCVSETAIENLVRSWTLDLKER
jgi:hypothetical protein